MVKQIGLMMVTAFVLSACGKSGEESGARSVAGGNCSAETAASFYALQGAVEQFNRSQTLENAREIQRVCNQGIGGIENNCTLTTDYTSTNVVYKYVSASQVRDLCSKVNQALK